MGFAYAHCKHAVGMETCTVDVGQRLVDFSYEVGTCMKSQPQCLRQRAVCLGRCNGDGGGVLAQDFATTIVKQELSVASLGQNAIDRGRVCTVHSNPSNLYTSVFYGGYAVLHFGNCRWTA
jgi:hypothetical protein